ncbi:MAG: nitrous oxide-stimulated promoter family protein [Lentisphaerae bacterium]|jgi:hypothetical protein|nr:nitrous oxide-stimulated promoter family protein [Lentisphaerota bacterium]MBT4819944.1 nitrous oxide-stimulated promoter family protein [Lentisphaerota bacterium]MBT5612923.1 nitrous oxide-stimulated promoter family protein [Lentisphaerota bacterium]MBT7061859.1 nitrous oxide-stimulated promoter family protein [Lentisphaerota bacterium]MBT7846967.1 nitrous oxide-stimulated promoter family protein [Lentisphaerota bacterium]
MSLQEEKATVKAMIELFCNHQHHADALCDDCSELLAYAEQRLGNCPFGDDKPTCRKCSVHCYSPEMRERIAGVMRFSGPRMALRHPIRGLRHLMRERRSGRSPEDGS